MPDSILAPLPGIAELIEDARTNPPRPVIEGLLNEGEIVGLHGPPEVFKTMFCIQLAEALALAIPFLGVWTVPHPRKVFFFETEMSSQALGTRLAKMFRDRTLPPGIAFADEARLKRFQRAPSLKEKFALLAEWVTESYADIVIVDTCNSFFRGRESANDETTAGAFFDLLAGLPASGKLFSRHNHKRREEDSDAEAAAKIRGSGQFGDVPDLLLELRRKDKRTHEAKLAVTKFRNGTKPEDLSVWFDSASCRLNPLPPVIQVLKDGSRSRSEILQHLGERFSIEQRKADDMIAEQREYLTELNDGHRRILGIDWEAARRAPWLPVAAHMVGGEICKVA